MPEENIAYKLAERLGAEAEIGGPLVGQPFKVWLEIARITVAVLGLEAVKLRLDAIENVEHAREHERTLAESRPLDLDPLDPVEKATRVWSGKC